MRKILAMLFACSIVLAGCIDLSDEDVAEIVEELKTLQDVMMLLHTIMMKMLPTVTPVGPNSF